MGKRIEVNVWDIFWKLKIIKEMPTKIYTTRSRHRVFLCSCECGNQSYKVFLLELRKWKHDCWCVLHHWWKWTRIYRIRCGMRRRCNNRKCFSYKDYWWRWIKVCKRWNDFRAFSEDMQEGYSDELTIDRIDNNWDYCKENCRRATMKEQLNNTRRSKIIIYNWEEKTVSEWSTLTGIHYQTLTSRIKKWCTLDEVFNKDLNFTHRKWLAFRWEKKHLYERCKELWLNYNSTCYHRKKWRDIETIYKYFKSKWVCE